VDGRPESPKFYQKGGSREKLGQMEETRLEVGIRVRHVPRLMRGWRNFEEKRRGGVSRRRTGRPHVKIHRKEVDTTFNKSGGTKGIGTNHN